MRTSVRWIPLVVCAAVVTWPSPADAQRRGGDPADRARIEQRIRAQMARMMQERLGLDEEQATRLSEVAESFESRRRELARQEFETRRRVEALLESGGDEAEARALLELQVALRSQEAELFREEQEALLEVLTATQLLELQDLRQDLGRRIRALRGGGRPDADRPRGPRGPGPDGRLGTHPMPGVGSPLS